MTPQIVILIMGALSVYSFFLVRRAAHVQANSIIPFLYRVHMPNVMGMLTRKEHDIIHDKIDIFNLRILTCFVAAVLAIGLSLFFIALISYEGDARILGYFISILFAYLVANYDVNSKAVGWIRIVEDDLFARIIVKNSEAAGFSSLADYFDAENDKMMAEYYEKWNKVAQEFDELLAEEGFDPDKNYEETEEDLTEYWRIMESVNKQMCEKYPDSDEDTSDD